MEPLASAADLSIATGLPASDPNLQLALKRASGRFRLAAGHPVTRVVNDEIRLSGDGTTTLTLPAANISDIAVTLAGVPLVEGTGYQVGRMAGYIYRAAGWPRGVENVVVVYSHGVPIDKLPDGVSDAVLEHATTLALTYAHVGQESTGNTSLGVNQAATVGTTQKWVDAVEAVKIRGRA